MPRLKRRSVVRGPLRAIILGALVEGCSIFSPAARMQPADIRVEELRNGYLVEILTERPFAEVTTLVTPANWVTITIADTLLDTTSVARFRSAIIDSTLVRRFETATQFSLRFVKSISTAELLRERRSGNVLISVFF